MTPDKARYYIIAKTAQNIGTVFYSSQPELPENCITIYDEGEIVNVHNTVMIARYQAIVRNTSLTSCETLARTILDAVRENNSLTTYNGLYLTAAIDDETDPVTFAPDDGDGTTTAGKFAVNDYILVNDEIMKVTVVSSPNVTVARAQLGTTIAAHANNDVIHNISNNPIPGQTCDSTYTEMGLADMGYDDRNLHEIAVNWNVRLKT